MSNCSHQPDANLLKDQHYRRVLWSVLGINAVMFVVEVISGFKADSMSLLADALDFMGDSFNYGISLYVLSKPLRWRAVASLIKAACMAGFGVFVLIYTIYHMLHGSNPQFVMMSGVGIAALIANGITVLLLLPHKSGDSNRMSAWVCSRNDALGNLAVILAAGVIWLTGSSWPDYIVAGIIAALALVSAVKVVQVALREF